MATTIPPMDVTTDRGLPRSVALATLIAVVFVGVISLLAGASYTGASARNAVERRAETLARMVIARLPALPREQWGVFATRTATRVGCLVSVVDPDLHVVEGSSRPPIAPNDPRLRSPRARAEAMFEGAQHFIASEPLEAGGTWRVLVALPLASRSGAVATLVVELITVIGALGALGLLAALVVARDITNDVVGIARRARRMSRGEVAALEPLPRRAQDEVGALVTAFNRLQRRFAQELEAHRRALARLEDNERRRGALIATLRHELRTPLNSIIGFAELLLSGVDGELTAMQREDVEMIASSGAHLLTLVDDVLDLSAIASGRFSIHPEPIDLYALARDVAREAEGYARRKNVTITVDGQASTLVEGDKVSLRRALTNLVHNAVEHAGGKVTVTVSTRAREGVVAVRDNGPGINPRDIKRLFKPFERGRTTAESARSGAGLGLAITVALLELHGGSLAAESEEGRGSTFLAHLPLRPSALAQAGLE